MARDDATWRPTAYPGVAVMAAPGRRDAVMLRFAPRARIPAYLHPHWEALTVLEGRLRTDGETWHGPGSYLDAPPAHGSEIYSDVGALLLVKLPPDAAAIPLAR